MVGTNEVQDEIVEETREDRFFGLIRLQRMGSALEQDGQTIVAQMLTYG